MKEQTLQLDCAIDRLVVNGVTESLYVVFRRNTPIKETLRAASAPDERMLIYVGKDDLPVAVQLVDRPKKLSDTPCGWNMPKAFMFAITAAFGLTCAYIDSVRRGEQEIGKQLLEDVMKQIDSIPNDEKGLLCA